MKNKKGFTLVELLAVIAILAILVVIAVPNVIKLFNDTKKSSFTTEAKNIYNVAKHQWINDSMFDQNEQEYSRCSRCNGKSLNLSGRNEIDYYININVNGQVSKYYATDGIYQFGYDGEDLKIEDIKDVVKVDETNGDIISIDNIVDPPQGDPALGTFFNTSNGNYYTKLNDAFTAVKNNQTIKMLNDSNETSYATLADTKSGIKLDLNGKQLKMNSYYITINGNLKIFNSSSDNASITGRSGLINNGDLTINEELSTNKIAINFTSSGYINNKGTLIVNQNTSVYSSKYDAINITSGVVYVNNAVINGGNGYDYDASGIYVGTSGELIVNGNDTAISGTGLSEAGIINYGKTTINDGTIKGSLCGFSNSGTLIMNGGIIKATSAAGSSYGIKNMGNTTITGGTINNIFVGVSNSGTLTITGGDITSSSSGIDNSSNGLLTLGSIDDPVKTDSPLIQATNSYGITNASTATFNFYDGIIKSAKGTGYSINGTVSSVPSNYEIIKSTVSGTETAILVAK